MSALGTNGLDLAGRVDEEDLGSFDAFHFDFPFLTGRQRQGADVLEFVLGHAACRGNEERFGWYYKITGFREDLRKH